jgi:hypothetical protein
MPRNYGGEVNHKTRSLRELERQKRVLEAGRRHLQAGELSQGLNEVQPLLPPAKSAFVFMDDLECLDLWLRFAVQVSPRPADYEARVAQLHDKCPTVYRPVQPNSGGKRGAGIGVGTAR